MGSATDYHCTALQCCIVDNMLTLCADVDTVLAVGGQQQEVHDRHGGMAA